MGDGGGGAAQRGAGGRGRAAPRGGPDDETIEPQPWGAWSVDPSGREITVHYAASSVGRPLEPLVEETPDEVRFTARVA